MGKKQAMWLGFALFFVWVAINDVQAGENHSVAHVVASIMGDIGFVFSLYRFMFATK